MSGIQIEDERSLRAKTLPLLQIEESTSLRDKTLPNIPKGCQGVLDVFAFSVLDVTSVKDSQTS